MVVGKEREDGAWRGIGGGGRSCEGVGWGCRVACSERGVI